jgi:TonB family protein
MTKALLYSSQHKWRFGTALGGAIVIHLAALSFATNHTSITAGPPNFASESAEIIFDPPEQVGETPPDLSEPMAATPPPREQSFPEGPSIPPSARKQIKQSLPITKPKSNTVPGSLRISSAKAFAISAPPPEYPYEARRGKIVGDGIALITVNLVTGSVISVSISKTTGSAFLDNAILAGFKRWRFRPGTVSSVACPVSFTLTGASY